MYRDHAEQTTDDQTEALGVKEHLGVWGLSNYGGSYLSGGRPWKEGCIDFGRENYQTMTVRGWRAPIKRSLKRKRALNGGAPGGREGGSGVLKSDTGKRGPAVRRATGI